MKKALALFAALAAMTCTLASCGSDKDEDKKDNGTSISESADDNKESKKKSDEESGEDESSEEESEKDESSEDESGKDESSKDESSKDESSKEEKKPAKSEPVELPDDGGEAEAKLLGAWLSDDAYGFRFSEGGKISVVADASSMMYFTDEGSFNLYGNDIGKEYVDFDGQTISIVVEGMDMLTMAKDTKGDTDSLDGTYNITSGAFYDGMASSLTESTGVSEPVAYGIIKGQNFYVEFPDLVSYTASGNEILFTGDAVKTMGLADGATVTFDISGDALVIHDTNGTDINLKKADY